jgi:hypothetical protein
MVKKPRPSPRECADLRSSGQRRAGVLVPLVGLMPSSWVSSRGASFKSASKVVVSVRRCPIWAIFLLT